MTSNRQIEANRRNAKQSTGPKTERGKARSSMNARRHGLSRPKAYAVEETEALARAILDGLEREATGIEPSAIVSARNGLARVRAVRGELLADFLSAANPILAKRIRGLARYENTAFAMQMRAIRTAANSGPNAGMNGTFAGSEAVLKSDIEGPKGK